MILVFGTVCLDRVRRVPNLPSPGGYVEVETETLLLGGEAANTANALENWGDHPTLAGNPLGESLEATNLRQMLSATKINAVELLTSGLNESVVQTPVCDIYVTDSGERTMFGRGFMALEAHVSLDRIDWKDFNWFTAEPNMNHLSRQAALRAVDEHLNIYLMDFVRPEDPVVAGSYWQSSTDWAGFRNNTQKNVQWVKQWVSEKGCFTILSDGPNGFVAGAPGMPARAYPPFPAPSVVDTTGAGDVFRAGMIHGLSLDWQIGDCLRFASAAGCLKCRTLGATSAVPTVEEIQLHIAENADVAKLYG